jgi:hypothetical protein
MAPVGLSINMNTDQPDEPRASWHPEADEAVLAAIASSLNRAFGRAVCARTEGSELIVQFGNVTAWIGTNGSLTGLTGNAPIRPS